jgi:hypothetical protein
VLVGDTDVTAMLTADAANVSYTPRLPLPAGESAVAPGGIRDIPIGELNAVCFTHHALSGSPRRCFRGLIEGGITL